MRTKNTLLFLIALTSQFLFSQIPVLPETKDSFSVDYLKRHALSFSIQNGKMTGEGSDFLNELISQNQFVVLGEYHGSSSISKFTEAILPELSKNGFNHFAIEVSPHSAKILEELSEQPSETSKNLFALNSKYYLKEMDDTPIPFFSGKEDAAFLTKASELNFNLWGLDQEYYYSVDMLGDILLERKKGAKNYEEIAAVKNKLDSLYLAEDKISESEPWGYRMFKNVLESSTTQQFFDYFNDDKAAQEIIAALKKSWDIYDRTDYRGGYSHGHRISYMRNNFIENYQSAKEEFPKVLIKVGGFHAGKSYAGSVYDVGNLANEIAGQNGTGCLNIRFDSRFWEEEGETSDESETVKNRVKKTFMQLGKMDEYVIVDLRPIAKQMRQFSLNVPNDVWFHTLKYLTENFDLVIINPLDKVVASNYRE